MQYETSYAVDYGLRNPLTGVDAQFYKRWSPRSFKKTAIPETVLASLFDAARWSPSCFNEQPWLFVTSSSDEDFGLFLDLLVAKNQEWAKNASLIGFIFAGRNFSHNNKPNAWAPFDYGAAWMALALQASQYGLYAHGMGGIKKDEVYGKLHVPEGRYEVICGFALGVIDTPEKLSAELAGNEMPSPRRPLTAMWKKGKFPD